jgi:hypothetical protein
MSVNSDTLTVDSCEYGIYTLEPNYAIHLAKKFKALWKAFYSFKPNPIRPQESSDQYTLPSVNNIILKGQTDPLSGFINFKAVNFTPSSNSAIMTEGIALNQYVRSVNKLAFQFLWKGDSSIQWVNIYFWLPSNDRIILGVDTCDRLSSYCGSKGSSVFSHGNGYVFVEAVSSKPNPTLTLTVTALPPIPEAIVPPSKVCLNVKCNNSLFSIPLYRYVAQGNFYRKVVEPQWQYIADLIQNTIYNVLSLPIPLAPLTAVEHSITNSIPALMISVLYSFVASTMLYYSTYYKDSIPLLDGTVVVTNALQDQDSKLNGETIYWSLQPASRQH